MYESLLAQFYLLWTQRFSRQYSLPLWGEYDSVSLHIPWRWGSKCWPLLKLGCLHCLPSLPLLSFVKAHFSTEHIMKAKQWLAHQIITNQSWQDAICSHPRFAGWNSPTKNILVSTKRWFIGFFVHNVTLRRNSCLSLLPAIVKVFLSN